MPPNLIGEAMCQQNLACSVKLCPNFCSVFGGKRTQQGYSKMEEIFHGESSFPLKTRATFYTGEG
jgi:hypothetical protein